MTSLIPVIQVDEKKCLNCHACISACPVKYCNDGSGDIVHVNHDMCIGSGHRNRRPVAVQGGSPFRRC